jgi:hypothetical protein
MFCHRARRDDRTEAGPRGTCKRFERFNLGE